MNQPLQAMVSKLGWQITEMEQQLAALKDAQKNLENECNLIAQSIQGALNVRANINPEQEIARLNFIIVRQQQADDLKQQIKEKSHEMEHNQKKLIRLNTELKMLQDYLLREHKKILVKQQLDHEKSMDEWALQLRQRDIA